AEKATGFSPSRKLHLLWAITKGSLIDKTHYSPTGPFNQCFPSSTHCAYFTSRWHLFMLERFRKGC
ncbi:MAG: hypothetical protein ACI9QV_001344, partial [Methylophagaceae bacterium]